MYGQGLERVLGTKMQLQGSDCSVEAIDNTQRLRVDGLFEVSKESFDGWKVGTGSDREICPATPHSWIPLCGQMPATSWTSGTLRAFAGPPLEPFHQGEPKYPAAFPSDQRPIDAN